MLSGRGLCDELITRPEELYRLCCVVVCELETSRMGAPYIYDISRLRVNFHIKHSTAARFYVLIAVLTITKVCCDMVLFTLVKLILFSGVKNIFLGFLDSSDKET